MIDLYDLLNHLCGYGIDDEPEYPEEDFIVKYGIEWERAELVIRDLMPLAMIAKSPLTEKVYQGFGKDGLWIVKQEFNNGDTAGGG